MTDASSDTAMTGLTVVTTSRLLRALHYEPGNKRLWVLTTHGSLHSYEGVPADTVYLISQHDHPGHAYLSIKRELGSRRSPYTIRGFISALRVKRAIRQALNQRQA